MTTYTVFMICCPRIADTLTRSPYFTDPTSINFQDVFRASPGRPDLHLDVVPVEVLQADRGEEQPRQHRRPAVTFVLVR